MIALTPGQWHNDVNRHAAHTVRGSAMKQRTEWSSEEKQAALETLIEAVEIAFDEGEIEIDRYSVCDIMAKLSAFVMVSALTANTEGLPPHLLDAGLESCVGQVRNEMKELTRLIESESLISTTQCSTTIH